MEIFSDWKFWSFVIACLNFLGIIFVFVANRLAFSKIMHNDLKHLAQDTKEIKTKQEEHTQKINHIDTEVAYLKGIRENEDKVIKLLETTLKNKQ